MVTWTVEFVNAEVNAELDELPADMQARFFRIAGSLRSSAHRSFASPT